AWICGECCSQVSLSSSITAAERNSSGTASEAAKHWTDGFLENLKRGQHHGQIDETARIKHLRQGPRCTISHSVTSCTCSSHELIPVAFLWSLPNTDRQDLSLVCLVQRFNAQ
ncbi:hypothetical protein AZE42_01263, partial [Rhizopogon vesiculosus]